MPPALYEGIKNRVIHLWFSDETRKDIASAYEIGTGSVSNIIDEWTRSLDSSDYESIRELAVDLKKKGLTFVELASIYRSHNYIEKLGANEDEVESLIESLLVGAQSLLPEKIVELINILFEISKSETIPPTEVPAYINEKIEEKKRLEDEIRNARAILDEKNVDIRIIEEFKRLKEELEEYGLTTQARINLFQSYNHLVNWDMMRKRSSRITHG